MLSIEQLFIIKMMIIIAYFYKHCVVHLNII